jgi:hypothetical protein
MRLIEKWLTYFIALVWLINGLFCKVLDLVPRHQEIVGRILGPSHARSVSVLIGLAETAMAVWILSGIYKRLNAVLQITVIASMNTLELFIAPDLLLWGKANAFFAFLFLLLIYYHQFHLNRKTTQHTVCSPS